MMSLIGDISGAADAGVPVWLLAVCFGVLFGAKPVKDMLAPYLRTAAQKADQAVMLTGRLDELHSANTDALRQERDGAIAKWTVEFEARTLAEGREQSVTAELASQSADIKELITEVAACQEREARSDRKLDRQDMRIAELEKLITRHSQPPHITQETP